MTGKQALIGCGIGCAAIVVLSVALVAGFGFWVTRPGQLIEPERLLTEDTTGYVAWTLRLEDPGTAGFVNALIERVEELRRQRNRALPEPFGSVLGALDRGSGGDLRQLFPLTVLWTSRPTEAGEGDLRLLSLSLPSGGNRLVFADWMLKWILGGRRGMAHSYRDERVYRVRDDDGDGLTFFIRGSDLFFVTDVATAERAIDQLTGDAPQPRPATALDQLYARAPAADSLRGAVSNERGELTRLWRDLVTGSGEAPWHEVSGLVASGSLGADGAFNGVIELSGRDADWARERSEPLVTAIRDWLAEAPFALESSSEVTDERVRIALRVPDVAAVVQRGDVSQTGASGTPSPEETPGPRN